MVLKTAGCHVVWQLEFQASTNVTSISCRWRTHATRCITANLLQTKVDAQCDKSATELLSWQRLRRSTFSSYSELFVESRQFYPTPSAFGTSVGVTPFTFAEVFSIRKLESCAIVWRCLRDPKFSRFTTPTCDWHITRGIYRAIMASCGNTNYHRTSL